MNKKNTEHLLNNYPELYKQYYLDKKQTCMCWGFDIEDGWFKLIDKLSKEIIELSKRTEAEQVKEKFGGLRFYAKIVADDETNAIKIRDLISKAEKESYKICEFCGKKGVLRQDLAWYKTACDKHYKILKDPLEHIKFRKVLKNARKN